VTSIKLGEEGTGEWDITGNEDFFRGHFPGVPVLPGVLIGEALAQLAGIVGLHTDGKAGSGRLVQVDVRFDKPVFPPAVVVLHATLTREIGILKRFDVSAECAGERVARGVLTLAELEGGGV